MGDGRLIRRRSGLDRALNERVRFVLTLDAGEQTFQGVLVANYADSVELQAPVQVDGDREDPVKGPLCFLKEKIAYWQRVS